MRIAVITAVYNRAATIGEAIASVQAQDHGDIEHLIQDGGSTDGTLEIIERTRDNCTLLVSTPDTGIYDALNKAMARCTGDAIGLVHSDDFFAAPNVISQVVKAFADPAVDGVYGDLDYVSAEEPARIIRHWRSGPYSRNKLRLGWMPPHPTLFVRRDVITRFGGYDTSLQIAADYDAMLRWLWTGNIQLANVPEVFVKMRVGGESNRSLDRIIQKSREDLIALRRNGVGGVGTLALKNLRKVGQFINR